MRFDRGYLEAILLASLLLLGGGYLAATSADETEQAVDLSFLEGGWDFNGLKAFVPTEAVASAAIEPKDSSAINAPVPSQDRRSPGTKARRDGLGAVAPQN